MARLSPLSLSRLLILCLTALNVYRAATLAITTDEAFTYLRSVIVPVPRLWEDFDANDHVLHTLLCKLSTRWLGSSEFTLRLPALVGGVLYYLAVLRICRGLFGETWFLPAMISLLTLNPLVLDYCSIARGYGLALALLLWAYIYLWRALTEPAQHWPLSLGGVCLALAVAANLSVAFPAAVLLGAFCLLYIGPPALHKQWTQFRARLERSCDYLAAPCALTAILLLFFPLLPAKKEDFYIGTKSFWRTLSSLGEASLARERSLLESTLGHTNWQGWAGNAWAAACLIVLAAGAVQVARRGRDGELLLGAMGVVSPALMAFLHVAGGIPYPERRTALFLAPLTTLLAGVCFRFAQQNLRRWAGLSAAALAAFYVANWNWGYYDEWRFDAANRRLMHWVVTHKPEARPVLVYASFPLATSLSFYKRIWKLDWFEVSSDMAKFARPPDVYVLSTADYRLLEQSRLAPRFHDALADVIVATPASSPPPLNR